MSGQDSAPVGLQPGPMVVEEDVVALVMFSAPKREKGGLGISGEVRARDGVPVAMVVGSLRALADSLEAEFGADDCPACGEDHG